MKKLCPFFCFCIITAMAMAQRPLGTWQNFLPYGDVIQVVQSDDRIYAATIYSVFYIEKSDGSITPLTKASGLSDASVRHMAYHPGKKTLIITYENSNIDLLVNGTDIYNIPDIKNATLSSSKNINDIAIIGEYAYLATDLGISVLDLDKQEIKDNYIIGSTGQSVTVNSIASDGSTIFAATAEGVKSASLSSQNLQDFNNWRVYGSGRGLPTGGRASMVGQINSKFYAAVSDTLYTLVNDSFTRLRYDTGYVYESFTNTGGYLYAAIWQPYNAKMIRIAGDGSMTDLVFANSPKPHQITSDGNTNWVADEWKGLDKYDGTTFEGVLGPAGPPTVGDFRMATSNYNTLYLCSGGTDPNYIGYNYDRTGPVIFNRNIGWQSYPVDIYGNIAGYFDLVDVVVDNVHSKIYYASLFQGLLEMNGADNSMTTYNHSNSVLALLPYSDSLTKITALCLDNSGNLWMSNNSTPQYIVVKTPDNHWASFSLPSADLVAIRQMAADDYGQIWMGGRGNNMIVYSPGSDVLSGTDDQSLVLGTGTGSGALPNGNVWSVIKDKSGDIWVGTDQGIGTFYCTGSMFSNNGTVGCDATKIKVDQGGFIGYLFSTEIVKAMAVDGANRKWVGTTNGVWLISDDGTKQLLHFNSDNSPLPDNNITSIAIDQKSGEVFIGTDGGLVSYMGDAILGNSTKGKAFVYPNPVRENYTGPIAIKGLVDDAYVKITDAAGILVFQGKANGGQMIWDGKGYNGKKVNTGIYLVYAATDGGDQHNVGKIIFIN